MKKVAVLFGGGGKERDVSVRSKDATLKALLDLGYDARAIDLPETPKELVDFLDAAKPDAAFNCLHGSIGEDGTVQAILNYAKIPYTHSGALASAIAMDKWKSHNFFTAFAVPSPKTFLIDVKTDGVCPIDFPRVLKPVNEGSSFGVKIARNEREWKECLKTWEYGAHALVQEYLGTCREIHVAVLNGEPLGTVEIDRLGSEFFDYAAKYVPGNAKITCPAELSPHENDLISNASVKAYEALGCRSLARIDAMFDGKTCFVLEVNTQPGFTATSLAPKIALSRGISFERLVDDMVKSARCD